MLWHCVYSCDCGKDKIVPAGLVPTMANNIQEAIIKALDVLRQQFPACACIITAVFAHP